MITTFTSLLHEVSNLGIKEHTQNRVIRSLDVTALKEVDEAKCQALVDAAKSYDIAAVCIQKECVSTLVAMLKGFHVQIATVVNFPKGKSELSNTACEIEKALSDGANEIDVVSPYHLIIEGDELTFSHFIKSCRALCTDGVLLKVILETGELRDQDAIKTASQLAIDNGADFIKTSTGFVDVGATTDAVMTMLEVIKASGCGGLKVSGGINNLKQAVQYFEIVDTIMGSDWASRGKFRFGSSQLLEAIVSDS